LTSSMARSVASMTGRSLIAMVPVREWSTPTLIGGPLGATTEGPLGAAAGVPSSRDSAGLRFQGPNASASDPTSSPPARNAAPRTTLRRLGAFRDGTEDLVLESRTDVTRDRSIFEVVVRRALRTYSARLQSWVNGARATATSSGRAK